MSSLDTIHQRFSDELGKASSLQSLDEIRIQYLGKKGEVKALLKQTGSLPPEERSSWGQGVNRLKNQLLEALDLKKTELESKAEEAALSEGWLDPTLPQQHTGSGKLHPITKVLAEVIDHFHSLGFEVASGPELEDEWHNFDALNIPKDHPARDVWDTFYLSSGEIPRTHTSSVQIRTLESREPPLRIIER